MPTSKTYIDGFPSLAAFIASDPDRTAGIFKRFDRLAARNLLNMQAELAELQERLDAYDNDDQIADQSLQSLRNWSDYKKREAIDPARMELMRKIKETMKEYRQALMFESTLAAIPPPDRKVLKAFRDHFFHRRPNDRVPFPTLSGFSATVYDDPTDLVSIHHLQDQDRLTIFVRDHFGYFFKEETPAGGSNVPIVGYASGTKLSSFVGYLSAILAAGLLFGSILVLYKVTSPDVKLGLVVLFTSLFAVSVAVLTNAKRSENYGSTAAYAAVLVVFISGNVGGPG
ncbi:hypothetical protein V8F20_002816 [Naviculisporaceae sp. PSN 640]